MMKKTWLLFDSNYLCWRAYHSTGGLSFGGVKTGVVFGYLKALLDLQGMFLTTSVAHCFDKGKSLRKEIYPEYKCSRNKKKELTQDEKESLGQVKGEIKNLRREYLLEIGCKNIFASNGYEGDDIIASICQTLPEGVEAIIVSADEDLYQLLSKSVSMYNPCSKKTTTEKSFREEWGLNPSDWSVIKALAGCGSDDVVGIRGVGEKTAAKHLRGELKSNSKIAVKILKEFSIVDRNLPIVKLPFVGCKQFVLVEDHLSREGWESLTTRLGMKSISNLRRLLPFNTNM